LTPVLNRISFCFKAARARVLAPPRAWAACSLAGPAPALAGPAPALASPAPARM
jgi:hypothetical protein